LKNDEIISLLFQAQAHIKKHGLHSEVSIPEKKEGCTSQKASNDQITNDLMTILFRSKYLRGSSHLNGLK